MYAIIQKPVANSGKFQVVRLADNARLSPAGYVVGDYKIIFPSLTIVAARKILNNLKGV